jgi:hypothetical protein
MLMRAVMLFIPDATAAGLVVSGACELIALAFLVKLAQLECRGDVESVRFTVWMLALYPYALFLSAVYTEAPFLAAATAALYYMRRGEHTRACVVAALAVAVRITGLALILALLVELIARKRQHLGEAVLAVAVPLLPLLLFIGYAQLTTGDALAYWTAEGSASFNRALSWPWVGAHNAWLVATSADRFSFLYAMELIFATLGLAAIVYMAVHWREMAVSLTVFAAGIWIMSTSFASWLSVPRYVMSAVPIYLAAAHLTRGRPQLRIAVLAVSAGWMAVVTTLFALRTFVA